MNTVTIELQIYDRLKNESDRLYALLRGDVVMHLRYDGYSMWAMSKDETIRLVTESNNLLRERVKILEKELLKVNTKKRFLF